jgi:hypothetical protein
MGANNFCCIKQDVTKCYTQHLYLSGCFGTTLAMGNVHKIWKLQCQESLQVIFFENSIKKLG